MPAPADIFIKLIRDPPGFRVTNAKGAVLASSTAGAAPPKRSAKIEALLSCSLKEASKRFETMFIKQALAKHPGNASAAARAIGLSPQTLRYRRKKLGI